MQISQMSIQITLPMTNFATVTNVFCSIVADPHLIFDWISIFFFFIFFCCCCYCHSMILFFSSSLSLSVPSLYFIKLNEEKIINMLLGKCFWNEWNWWTERKHWKPRTCQRTYSSSIINNVVITFWIFPISLSLTQFHRSENKNYRSSYTENDIVNIYIYMYIDRYICHSIHKVGNDIIFCCRTLRLFSRSIWHTIWKFNFIVRILSFSLSKYKTLDFGLIWLWLLSYLMDFQHNSHIHTVRNNNSNNDHDNDNDKAIHTVRECKWIKIGVEVRIRNAQDKFNWSDNTIHKIWNIES